MPCILDRAPAMLSWLARIAGLLLALFFLAFVIGEGFPGLSNRYFRGLQPPSRFLAPAGIAAERSYRFEVVR